MFDLFNLGGGNYQGMQRRAGIQSRPFGNPEAITQIAFVIDEEGEWQFDFEEAKRGESEGHYRYFGYRTVGNIVEHRYVFSG